MRTYIYIYADDNIYIDIIIIPDTTDCCVYNIYIHLYIHTYMCIVYVQMLHDQQRWCFKKSLVAGCATSQKQWWM